MGLEKTPDAVLFPAGTFTDPDPGLRINAMQKAFGKVLGAGKNVRCYVSEQGNQRFVTKSSGHVGTELLFVEGHPRAKEEAYVWFIAIESPPGVWNLGDPVDSLYDADNEVKFGYRKQDDTAGKAEVQANIEKAMAERLSRHNTPERARARIERLRDAGVLTRAEAEEDLKKLEAEPAPEAAPQDKPTVAGSMLLPEPGPDEAVPIGIPAEEGADKS